MFLRWSRFPNPAAFVSNLRLSRIQIVAREPSHSKQRRVQSAFARWAALWPGAAHGGARFDGCFIQKYNGCQLERCRDLADGKTGKEPNRFRADEAAFTRRSAHWQRVPDEPARTAGRCQGCRRLRTRFRSPAPAGRPRKGRRLCSDNAPSTVSAFVTWSRYKA